MKDFFKQYPKAKSCWKVGDKYFLHAFEQKAKEYAAINKLKVEQFDKPSTQVKPEEKIKKDAVK